MREMAGNSWEDDSIWSLDLQDPILIGSPKQGSFPKAADHAYAFQHTGGPKRESSAQLLGNGGKKSKKQTDKDHRAKKKDEVEKMKAEIETLKANKFHLEGQAFQLEKDLKETRAENIRLNISQVSQNKSLEELQKVVIALGEQHEKKMNALKARYEEEMNALKARYEEEMNALKARNEQMLVLHKQLVCSECNLEETLARAPNDKCIICGKDLL